MIFRRSACAALLTLKIVADNIFIYKKKQYIYIYIYIYI